MVSLTTHSKFFNLHCQKKLLFKEGFLTSCWDYSLCPTETYLKNTKQIIQLQSLCESSTRMHILCTSKSETIKIFKKKKSFSPFSKETFKLKITQREMALLKEYAIFTCFEIQIQTVKSSKTSWKDSKSKMKETNSSRTLWVTIWLKSSTSWSEINIRSGYCLNLQLWQIITRSGKWTNKLKSKLTAWSSNSILFTIKSILNWIFKLSSITKKLISNSTKASSKWWQFQT